MEAFPPPGAAPGALRIALLLMGVEQGPTQLELRFGRDRKVVSLAPNQAKTVIVSECAAGGHVTGTARGLKGVVLPDGRQWAGRLMQVSVQSQQGSGC